jgi:DNA-binding response OmpR family regulator
MENPSNEWIEIKGNYTFDELNMKDRKKSYVEHGYKCKVILEGKEIEISKREAEIIQYFAANPNRVISREELYREVWDDILTDLGTRTTDMHIAKLRSKIERDVDNPQIIKTVRGAGYKYETQS